jgi:hypothetical protein
MKEGSIYVGATGGSAVFGPEAQTRRELAEVRSPAQFGVETRIGKIRNDFCMEAKWSTK